MYAFFGNKRPAKSLKWRIDPQEALHKDDLKQEEDLGEIMNTRLLDTVNYIAQKGPYPAWTDTKSKYYAVGDEVYPDILADLKRRSTLSSWSTLSLQRGRCGTASLQF